MRFAVNVPNFGEWADPQRMVDLAVAAESAGWDGFFVWDHILFEDGMAVADAWAELAAIAHATERITIGPMVTPVPRRRPWVLARQVTTVDRLSGGRLVLGVGTGYPSEVEFGTFGEPIGDRERADRLDEGLAVMAGMWSGEPFGYEGSHYTVRTTTFAPRPDRRVPIWVAGMWPNRRPFRRAAAFDGMYPIAADFHMLSPDEVAEVVAYVHSHRTGSDRYDVIIGGPPPATAEVAAYEEAGVTWYVMGPDHGERADATRSWVGAGPPP